MIRTGSFWRCGWDPRAVSIAKQAPDFFVGRSYTPLVPTWGQLSRFKQRAALVGVVEANCQFETEYRRQLARLDVHKVGRELDGFVLCCWEHDPTNPETPCHRTVAAGWLRAAGYEVTEVECHEPIRRGMRPKRHAPLQLDLEFPE